jgi:translocation and assembly module TamB
VSRRAGWLRRVFAVAAVGLSLALRLSWLLLVSALALLSWLLFTVDGARWAAQRVIEIEPRLRLSVERGNLWQGVDVTDLGWAQDGLSLRARRAGFRWDPVCLMTRTVCLDAVDTRGLELRVEPLESTQSASAPTAPGQRWALPVTVRLAALRAENTTVQIDGHQLALAALNGSGVWAGEQLRVEHLDLSGVAIRLADPAADLGPGLLERLAAREDQLLPRLGLPLDLQLDQLEVRALSLRRGAQGIAVERLVLRGQVDQQEVRVQALELTMAGLRARVNGQLQPSAEWPFGLSARIELSDPWSEDQLDLTLEAWNSLHAVELDATLTRAPTDRHLPTAVPSRLGLRGTLAPLSAGMAHDLRLDWSDLGWPVAGGQQLGSERGALRLSGELSAWRLALEAQVAASDAPPLSLALSAAGGLVGARIERLHAELADAMVTLAGDLDWSNIEALDVNAPAWSGRLTAARLEHSLLGPAVTLVDSARFVAVDATAWAQPHCWQWLESRLCLLDSTRLAADGSLRARLSGLQLERFAERLPDWLTLGGVLGVELQAQWTADAAPSAKMGVSVRSPALRVSDPELGALDPLLTGLDAEVRLADGQLALQVAAASQQLGGWELTADVEPATPVRIDGRLRVDALPVQSFLEFLPQLRTLQGLVDADVDFAGPLSALRWGARLRVRDAAVETLDLPVLIRDIGFDVTVDEERAELDGRFRSGEGEGSLEGVASWRGVDDWEARVRIVGEGLDVAYDAIAALRTDLDLTLEVVPGELLLGGRVTVPEGRITVDQLPAGAVAASDDVIIINGWSVLEQGPGRLALLADVPESRPGWVIRSDLEILLGDALRFNAFGLTGELVGRLRLQQLPDQPPQASGEVRIVDGEYRAYGQRLQIERGLFLFSGPLDRPNLLVEAVRRSRRPDGSVVLAGVRLDGSPQDPLVTLYSEPAMNEDAILAYLLLGRPLSEGGVSGARLVGEAALGWGVAGGRGLADRIASELGIADFEIDTEQADGEAYVVMRGRLSPNVFVSYGVGLFDAHDTLLLRYRLSRRLYVEAVSGLENAVDLLYSFEFGPARPQDRHAETD